MGFSILVRCHLYIESGPCYLTQFDHFDVINLSCNIMSSFWHQERVINIPFTQSLRPLCLPRATIKLTRSPLDVQRRQHGWLGRSQVVNRTFNNRHGRHQVLNVFKTVAEGSPRRLVAQRSLKWDWGNAAASPWSAKDRHVCVLLQSSVPQCGRRFCLPSASSVPPIACFEWWLWRPLCLQSATMARLEHPCRWFCLLSASFMRLLVPPHPVFK